jgi:DNA-binding Lrp family transcriptional regulator
MTKQSFTADSLDHKIIHALQLDGRVSFARLGQLLDVSEQTVARRFRQLMATGILRVVGMVDPAALGESSWMVRIQSRPGAALALAEALSRRDDVGWVSLTSGGAEIVCTARSRTSDERDELLLRRLPKTREVTGFTAQAMIHRFDDPASWTSGLGELTDEQAQLLTAERLGGGARSADIGETEPSALGRVRAAALSDEDNALLAELAFDGRATVSRLAQLAGWTATRVTRRLDELVRSGLLYFDAEVAVEALGFRAMSGLWLTVAPADLERTGKELAGHREIAFLGATTGTSNLFATAVCRDSIHLYRYVVDRLGSIGTVRQLEISPFVRRLKQSGSMMDGARMVIPTR